MSFCTVISCIDGRIQLPVNDHLRNRFKTLYVDTVTEAGPVGVLAGDPESAEAQSIFRRVAISLQAHSSKKIAIVAHYDCAGNPVSEAEQKSQLQACLALMAQRYPRTEIIGLWLDADWAVYEVGSVP